MTAGFDFSIHSLEELRMMLRDVLGDNAEPRRVDDTSDDGEFTRAISHEIARREKMAE